MKKRTSLVCFLIFTLCVFYTAIPNTVFGQEDPVALAEQVFNKYSETLQRENVAALLPEVLNGLKDSGVADIPGTIDLAITLVNSGAGANLKAIAAAQNVDLTDDHIALLGDADVQKLLKDETTKKLLGLKGAELQAGLTELLRLTSESPDDGATPDDGTTPTPDDGTTPTPDDGTTPTPDDGTTPTPDASLAAQVVEKHKMTFQRDDVKTLLPQILTGLQGAGDDVDIPTLIDTALTLVNAGSGAALQTLAAGQGVTLTDEHITLLGDADVQALLTDETTKQLLGLKGAELQAGLAEFLMLVNALPDDGTTPPDDGTTPPDDGTTPPDDGTTPPDDGTTPPDDGTTPPDDGTTPPDDGMVPPPKASPADPITPTNLTGLSKLGGLSLNPVNMRQIVEFARQSAADAGYGDLPPEAVASLLARAVPKGFFPKDQIERTLLNDSFAILLREAEGLDAENFGNAITPDFADFAYYLDDIENERKTAKYLTSDGLHLYVRVPEKLDEGAGVAFNLTDASGKVQTHAADEITGEFQADTISYTFRLEETPAAGHLPAWPDLENNQLFSSVTLRWHDQHDAPFYNAEPMDPIPGKNGGVVWEVDLGIPPDRGSTYYYFDVVLAKPLSFSTLDRGAIKELDPTTVTLDQVFDEANRHKITIDGWSMPDPRNLQLIDRGIISQLLTPDLLDVFSQVDFNKVIAGDILNLFTRQQLNKIQSILLRNTEALTSTFEQDHDPMIASVFTVPRVDLERHSLWVASISDLDDGNYNLEAIVHDAEGNPLDQIQENFTVDTSAPEADIEIDEMAPGPNATGYWKDDETFVATAPEAGTVAVLSITADPTDADEIGMAKGYLLYQMVGLNADGTFYAGEASSERPNTWMPLTVQSTMLTSTVWDAIRGAISGGRLDLPPELESNSTLQLALGLNLEAILGLLQTDPTGDIRNAVDGFVKSLEGVTGFDKLNDTQYQLIVDALGATVDIIDHLVPVTFDAAKPVMMLIQLEEAEKPLVGDYGIRAMGIDTLFNVGAYAKPTHLKIVDPLTNIDRATIMDANIGDVNNDGMVHPEYETKIIYTNTKDVMISGTVENPKHPIVSVMLQYMDANGDWKDIPGPVEVMGANFKGTWNVIDFDALIGAEDTGSVKVRAIATNALELKDNNPPMEYEYTIRLDRGHYPPEVLTLEVDTTESGTNPDSGAPQGMVTINATTRLLTGPRTASVRFEAKRETDEEWIPLGDDNALVSAVDAAVTAVNAADEGTAVPIGPVNKSEWSITVDTTTLEDTITKDNPGARDVTLDDNPYTIRALAVSQDGTEWPIDPTAAASTTLSVDNVDDVEPEGPTNITGVANADGAVAADPDGGYTLRGLIDENDSSVVPQTVTLTIEPEAERKTYKSVMLVSDPEIDASLIGESMETSEGSGVFEVTIDVGALGIDGNGTYMLHALAYDASPDGPDEMYGNVQTDASPESTVHVKNYERPDPAVFKLMVDVGTETNVDSDGPQGTFEFTGYTIEQNSPSIASVLLKAKRANDTDWQEIGKLDVKDALSVDIDGAALPDVLDYLIIGPPEVNDGIEGVVFEGTKAGNRSVVAIGTTYKQWVVSVDTVKLADTITKDSPAARDASKDDNQYEVRAFAVDADGKEWPSDATAMFSLDNVDDVAPLAPTGISVEGVAPAEDGSYTVGGLVDKYDDKVASPVATFTITPVADRDTYESVRLAMYPEGALVGEITPTEEEGVFTVTVDVGTLADGETYLKNGTYTFQALAKDEFGNEETDGSQISVTVENTYRPAPEVLIIAVDTESITQTNPDSGAPQGTIALNARSHEITSPPISGMRYEVKHPGDEAWIDVGTATEPMVVSEVSDAELADFVGDVATAAVSATEANESGEATVVPINRSQTYREWTLEVDTTTLEDTITADSPAARDASKDDNQYMVRVTAIAEDAKAPDAKETPSADGITAHFSVDNVDDVAPIGPTPIVAVADVAGMIEANEDGSYTVGGIVDDTVPSPIAIFTAEPTADPMTYASVNLVQTTEDTAETVVEGEAGILDLTIDVGMLDNGTYMFHALAVDEAGNVQTDESPMVTVHVQNFKVADVSDITVIAVDGTDVAEPPAEPIPLRNSVTVSFMVADTSVLAAEELSGAVNGAAMPSESADHPENTFSLMVEVGSLTDDVYTPDAVVTKRNGSVAFPVTTVNVDNTGPMITIESPTDGDTVDSLPTVHASYHDGEGSGTDKDGQEVLPWATTALADGPTLAIARVQPEQGNTDVEVDQTAVEADNDTLVYTRIEKIPGGAYTITVQVADVLGNVGTGTREFVINGTAPTVAIQSPAPGQTFEHGQPLISGELSGTGTVDITTFTVNDVEATPEVDGNQFSYTPDEALTNGDYKVVVAVTDGNGNTAQTSVVFMVDIPEPPKDTTPPVISAAAPNGIIKDTSKSQLGGVVISAVVTDEQSDISSVKYSINGVVNSIPNINIAGGRIKAPIDFETHGPGLYNVQLSATSQGGTTEHSWTFTLVIDDVAPTISSITPNGTIRTEMPTISVSATDESGIDKIRISVFNAQNQQLKGSVEDDAEGKAGGITRADFIPDNPLTEGTYLIIVDADDTLGNTATARGSFMIDFDTAAPIITMASPQENARFILKQGDEAPTVSVAYADAESGIDVESVRMVIEGVDADYKATASGTQITFKAGQKSASQAIHPLLVDTKAPPETWVGKYTVRFEVSDKAHLAGYVSAKNKGTREANSTVHTFSFFLEATEVPLLAEKAFNAPNPFKDSTAIRFTLTRKAKVNIVIYDTTLRPVRVLRDGIAEPGKKEIEWDGTSSAGVDLARGVYFCQIIVADDIEPEYAMIKLALTR